LLSEIHHRVKNNLAVISGLIEFQSFYVKDDNAVNILKDSMRRIKGIGLLHEKLYNSGNYEKVQLAGYIDDLLEYVKNIFPSQSKNIKFELNISSVELLIQEALPLSLILNEFITNSLKYAFTDRSSGLITISITRSDDIVKMCLTDNGCGFDINEELKESSLGMNLISSLSKQLGNNMELVSDKNGTVYKLEFSPERVV
jgi:two-component sensor histidine kinase